MNAINFLKIFLFNNQLISGCIVADILANDDTKVIELSNLEPVLRSLGGHLNWFVQEYSTQSLKNLKKHYLDSPEVKVIK